VISSTVTQLLFLQGPTIAEYSEMPNGKIKKVLPEKGFGFIEGERGDLFFHHSELQGTTIEQLREGQAVQYEIGQGKKGPCAVSIRLVG
jgi:cold shock protein